MFQIQLKFLGQSKKITVAKSLSTQELSRLISQCFELTERIVGVTDNNGKFHELSRLTNGLSSQKESFSLVTVKDVKQQSMSFATQYYERQQTKEFEEDQGEPTIDLPEYNSTNCMGIINDFELFEQLVLPDDKVTVVACFTKNKPAELAFEYYLYQNEQKNSVMVFSGLSKVCEFYINDWVDPSPEVGNFIEGLTGENSNSHNMKKKRSYDQFNL